MFNFQSYIAISVASSRFVRRSVFARAARGSDRIERIELDTSLVTVISRVIDYFYTVIGYLCKNPAECRDIPTMFRGISRNYPQNERWTRFPGAQLNVTGRFQIRNMKSIWSRDEWAVVFQREWKSAGINVPRAIRANPFFLSSAFLLSLFS